MNIKRKDKVDMDLVSTGVDLLWEYKTGDMRESQVSNLSDEWSLTIALSADMKLREGDMIMLCSGRARVFRIWNSKLEISFDFYTDAKTEPLHLAIPQTLIRKTEKHNISLYYSRHRISLLLDNELVDEEWPLGELGNGEFAIHIFSKDLIYAAIKRVDQLKESMVRLQKTQKITASLQYWMPPGHNTRVGDCMPFYHEGRFHLYYLLDRRGHKSKWGLGAHEWAHISTKDLKSWEIHPIAVPITQQWEGSICTGSVLYNKGSYYAFYAVRMSDYSPARITYAISSDGIHFDKSMKYISLNEPYEPVSARDPKVFEDDYGLFHMLVTTELVKPETPGRGGCLAHLVSRDLENWEQQGPFIVPGYTDQPECCDYFFMKGWYYLIFSNYGVARYIMSRNPFGPWTKPEVDTIDGYMYRVPKTAAFGNKRRLAAGFVPKLQNDYAGCVTFREVIQENDGTLSTTFPPEFLFDYNKIFVPNEIYIMNDSNEGGLPINEDSGYKETVYPIVSARLRVSTKVVPRSPFMQYGILLKTAMGSKNSGYRVVLDTARRKAGIHSIDNMFLKEDEWHSIYNLNGLNEPTDIDLVVHDDIIDLCINGKRTLITRVSDIDGVFVDVGTFTMFGTAEFREFQCRYSDNY